MKRNKKRKIIMLIIFLLICFIAFYNGLTIRSYKIKTDKLSKDQSLRIVLITDLHSNIYGRNQSTIIKKIVRQRPDIIALAGDIADDNNSIEGTKQFLNGIQAIAPIYYVTGNHEFWSNEIEKIRELFRSYNVTILADDYKEITINGVSLIIGGADDPEVVKYENPRMDWNKELISSFVGLKNKTQYKILLSHRPELIETYKQTTFDLVLSGHAHGGQVRIPFILNGLLAPNQGWFPKYSGGLYKYKNITHVISRGVSYNRRIPRIFNPPEIVVIDIEG